MRHGHGLRKLGRTTSHRLAMLRNMTVSLLRHEEISTTLPKAKELRRVAERMITLGKKVSLANRRLATVGVLASVIIGSTTRRSSLALGSVVLMISCLSSELVMFFSMAKRWLLVRLSFLSPRW